MRNPRDTIECFPLLVECFGDCCCSTLRSRLLLLSNGGAVGAEFGAVSADAAGPAGMSG